MTSTCIDLTTFEVRALLEGRLSQVRRVVRRAPPEARYHLRGMVGPWAEWETAPGDPLGGGKWSTRSPFGEVGARLWVRETWLYVGPGSGSDLPEYVAEREDPKNHKAEHCWYRSDPSWDSGDPSSLLWTPSTHMPRWASRIVVVLTALRVERLQQLSPEDAVASGTPPICCPTDGETGCHYDEADLPRRFAERWDDHARERRIRWASDPWVWVLGVERERVAP